MIKKILALVIAVMMIMSVAVIAASAEQAEIVENGADAAAAVAADGGADSAADAGADSAASANSFKFNPNGQWNNFSTIYCHIFVYGGASLAEWQTKKEKCSDNGDGTWTYDLDAKGFALENGTWYCIMFSADTGVETYQTLMDASCLGDTLTVGTEQIENPVDSSKKSYVATFSNHDASVYGPVLAITSIGNVVGSAPAPGQSKYSLFVKFLQENLLNARTYSGKNDQQLLDDTAKTLGLGKSDVEAAIAESGVTDIAWSKDASSLADESSSDAKETNNSSAGSGGSSSSGSSSSSSGSSSSGSSSSSSGASGTASGSTKTGQETTVLFIALGVMVAAAGVIFFARKRAK